MVNRTLFKYQKATMRSTTRVYRDGERLIDRHEVRLGKTVMGSGTLEQSIPLKRELNRSHLKRREVNKIYNHVIPDLKKRRGELYIHKASKTLATLGEHFIQYCKVVKLVPTMDDPDFVQFQKVFLERVN